MILFPSFFLKFHIQFKREFFSYINSLDKEIMCRQYQGGAIVWIVHLGLNELGTVLVTYYPTPGLYL